MKVRNEIYKKVFVSFFIAFIITSCSFFIYSLLTGKLSFSSLGEGWDGISVATQFESGNGTKENPYIIRSPEEFVYFKNLIEGDNYQSYQDKYYAIEEDLNFGDNSFSSIGNITVKENNNEDRFFKGHLDGRGHTIANLKIDQSVIVEDISYYSLFTRVENASIENLIMKSFKIEVKEDSQNVIVGFIGDITAKKEDVDTQIEIKGVEKEQNIIEETEAVEKEEEETNKSEETIKEKEITIEESIEPKENVESSSLHNITFINFTIDYSNTDTDNNRINVITNSVPQNTELSNIVLFGTMKGNKKENKIGLITENIDGKVSNITSNISLENMNDIDFSNQKIENLYLIKNGKVYLEEEEISKDDLLTILNKGNTNYYWEYDNNEFVLKEYAQQEEIIEEETQPFTFSIRTVRASISAHDSGVDGNTVYINDLNSDYNYFKGLNYTEVRSSSLPNSFTGYYNDDYLVKVQIIYDGTDINFNYITGNLSPINGENTINRFVYYKYYSLERNNNGSLLTNSNGDNYIHIELIDNPFSKRPYVNNKEYGFNGWVCNQNVDTDTSLCESAKFGFIKANYTRYVDIPATGGSEIIIHLNANWIEADVETSSSYISDFNQMSMQPMSTFSHNTTENVSGKAYWKQNYATMVFSRTYVNSDGNMPRGIWYKTNQYGTSYTYNNRTNRKCPNGSTCYVYTANTSGIVGGTEYVSGNYSFVPNFNATGTNDEITIYYYNNTYMNFVPDPNGTFWDTVQVAHYTFPLQIGQTTLGLFYQVSNPTTAMINTKEYYTADGTLCTNASNCTTAYKLIQYNDSVTNGRGNTISMTEGNNGDIYEATKYFYLVTRDTNIFRYTSTTHLDMSNLEVNRPFTVTGTTVNGTSTSGILEYPSSGWFITTYSDFQAANDIVIENIKIDGPDNGGSNNTALGGNSKTSQVIYANSHNLKIGRNVTSSDDSNYLIAQAVLGGNNSNVSGKFRVIIESGNYYAYHSGPMAGSTNTTLNETTIIGSDYDRVRNINNKLRFNIGIDGYAGGHNTAGSDSLFASYNIVKSGTLGYNADGTANTDNTAGMYIGGRSSTCVESLTGAKIEGGNINTVVGGYGYNGSTTTNSTFIGMSGGTVRSIYGGAGHSTTKGNRIINVTGGTVKYSVLGGSDSYSSNDTDDGVVQGSTLVYIGGDSIIGDGSTDELNGVESGSVFGAGGGRDPGNNSTTTKGTVYNSHVIINGGTIAKSVYGGGNFGSTGTQSNTSASTVIDVYSGTIGSIYGGSKTAGFSKSNYLSQSTIDINITGGTIGTIYGGSDNKGTIYGLVDINISDATITGNVYGGGRGENTFVDSSVNVTIGASTTGKPTITGSVYGGSAYGTVNAASTNGTTHGNTTITVNNGVIQNNVFGGAQGSSSTTPYVRGNITVNINNGSIGKVFGGFDASGKPSAGDVVYLNGGTIGNAFGGGNNADQDSTDIRLQGSTITGNLYGGSNLSGTVTTSHITVTSGTVTDIYGGNNLDGRTVTTNVSITGSTINGDIYGGGNEAPSTTSNVTITGYTDSLQDVYGGGKEAGVTTTNVTVQNDTLHYIFGGSNVSGNVGTSNVHITNSTVTNAYGGNNQGGQTTNTNIETTSSTITKLFGGGDNAQSGTSHVTVHSGTITEVYGGGNEAGLTESNVLIENGTITNLFGGSNESGNVGESNVQLGNNISNANIVVENVYGGNNQGGVTTNTNINALEGRVDNIYGGGNEASVGSTHVKVGEITVDNIYGGGKSANATGNTVLDINNTTVNEDIFGGGDAGSVGGNTNISITNAQVSGSVFAGGNAAGVTGNTTLDMDDTIVSEDIFGGGNEGIVSGSTNVFVTDSHIFGNAFAGGNGSTAVVQTNSTITIDGTTEIGTSTSVAPVAGCVFGSGNAASTGVAGVDTSVATVNLVGGIIHGNVYGGPKMAVVYGTTDTNIGTSAVSINGLLEDDIHISGTVFGGGESNASGSETYDWTFISVTEGIDVVIDGTGYINNNHDFIMNGSVFGSGNASSSSGVSNITIKNLGSRAEPNKSISIQRANNLVIDHSVIELEGTTDRTNEYSDILYSFNIIDKLILKNDSVLLLQHNANLLKELYSGVDRNGSVVPATVDIDEENESVTKNVDNRIYMLPGQNLNVTINQAATAYGRVTGMTFFGMYTGYDNGTYRYGLYDDDLDYGDSGNAGLEIVGGSYVIGMHNVNHDITKDGFYSNYLNEDYTEVTVNYIDPSPIGETGYRWIIGFEAINYEFTLTASKYSSLGTYELQLIDFADGNTNFSAIGFDSSGLNPDIQLVDSTNVPRVGRTEAQANNILGLSMKAETQEWTGYGTTKLLSQNNGTLTGDRDYRTDSRKLPPSLMFYLYHAKNINSEGRLGTVVLTLRAEIPKNAIDYDIVFVTVTINLVARRYDDADSYDASITYDKRYEMPSSTLVNITNQSQFSTYYSLIAWSNRFESVYGNNNQNYHVLTTNHHLPVNTMITMLDYSANENRPEYYYFKVTQSVYNDSVQQLTQYNEVVYPLRNFIKMDSTTTTNTYNDSIANLSYYDSENGLVDEEFMFIFDFKETTTTGEHLGNSMLFELRNHEDRTVYNVLGIRESLMVYNTYDSSNIVLNQTFTDTDTYLYYNVADEFEYSTRIQYNETENRQSVIDTNYESSSMGLNISFYDRDGVPVSSSMLTGTSIVIDNREYFADGDGIFRIKLANKVSNLDKLPKLTVTKDLPPGEYKIRYTLFASDDGLHNSIYENSVTQDFTVYVVSSDNSIIVDCDAKDKIIDGATGKNMNNVTTNVYHIKYTSQLSNPNLRVELFKRNTDTIDSLDYTSIPFRTVFSNAFITARGNEMYLDMNGLLERNMDFNLQTTLTSGTYRLVFKLYDNDQLIDSEAKYFIIHKKTE